MGKKNSSGATGADQRILLPEMRMVAGNPGRFAGIAGACLAGKSIDTAPSGTKDAGF